MERIKHIVSAEIILLFDGRCSNTVELAIRGSGSSEADDKDVCFIIIYNTTG
ncbi:MAG: hypothetical protein HQ557_09560 [Bacteroidetes bacterium]|nr:hypothetical protein [Bacteroidota bacterium]